MNCFYHPDRPAVGLCRDCAALVDDSIACKNRHEAQVYELALMTKRNQAVSLRTRANYMRNALFYLFTGLTFSAFGLYEYRWLGVQGFFLLLLGAFLLYAGVANYMESQKFKN